MELQRDDTNISCCLSECFSCVIHSRHACPSSNSQSSAVSASTSQGTARAPECSNRLIVIQKNTQVRFTGTQSPVCLARVHTAVGRNRHTLHPLTSLAQACTACAFARKQNLSHTKCICNTLCHPRLLQHCPCLETQQQHSCHPALVHVTQPCSPAEPAIQPCILLQLVSAPLACQLPPFPATLAVV